MPEDRRGSGDDPTLTPSQVIGEAATSASLDSAPRTPATGALPARYQLGPQLGQGGMGEVLLATDKQIDRDVAIKRMRMAPTTSAVARFIREAKIQGRLDHPAIVPVHELATDDEGRPFFVMKRLTGTTLSDHLGRTSTKPLSRQRLLRVFADVCLAIEFAHSRGVIHRDLKPANIMLGDYGEVYVLDWGVARMLDEHDEPEAQTGGPVPAGATEVGAILGTPGYISPELLRGKRPDARADVYALGCILYEILAGEPLLPRGIAALEAALGEVDARPSKKVADVPPELDAVCLAATARERDERPTARGLADSIERFLDGDRDVALRKSLAEAHVAASREARAAGDGEQTRATAMREAGRALALDPRNPEAAELIGRMMLEPPREIPLEVETRLALLEEATGRQKVKLMERVLTSFLVFIPALLVMGLRSRVALGVLLAAILVNLALTASFARKQGPINSRDLVVAWIVFSALIGVIARLFSPFLLAPGLAATSVMMFAMDPRTTWRTCALAHVAAVLVPWLLEVTGVVSATTLDHAGDLVLHSEAVSITMPAAALALAAFVTILIFVAGFMANRLALAHRDAVGKLELQAWHLRQLVGS